MWLKWTKSHQPSLPLLDRVNMGLMWVFNPLMEPCLIPLNPFCTWWMLYSRAELKPRLIVNSIVNSPTDWCTYWNGEDLCFHHSEVLTPPALCLGWIFSYGWRMAVFFPKPCFDLRPVFPGRGVCSRVLTSLHHTRGLWRKSNSADSSAETGMMYYSTGTPNGLPSIFMAFSAPQGCF